MGFLIDIPTEKKYTQGSKRYKYKLYTLIAPS